MTYSILQKFKKISSSEINANFRHVYEGDWLPMTGTSLLTTGSGALNLGSDSNKWKTVHVQNVEMTGELSNAWNLISETILTDTATSIEITNLNGNTDELYYITWNVQHDKVAASTTFLYLYFNGDSATNYGFQALVAPDTSVQASRTSSHKAWQLGLNGSSGGFSSGSHAVSGEMYIYAKSGYERLGISTLGQGYTGKWMQASRYYGSIWNNTTDTITSIKFEWNSGTLGTGSSIQLWAKR